MTMNLYLRCVVYMTVCQMTYDISIFPILHACSAKSGNGFCTGLFSFGYSFGGAGAAVWSLYLILLAMFTVQAGRQPTQKEQLWVTLGSFFILACYGVPYFTAGYEASQSLAGLKKFGDLLVIYNYLRLAIIGLSFIAVSRMWLLLNRVTAEGQRKKSPLYHLLRKLVLYPIVQCVTRLGTTPYDLWYHSTFASYPENGDGFQTFLAYLEVILAPTAGIGAFLVFLVMQPGAKVQLWRMMCLDFSKAPIETVETTAKQRSHRSKKDRGSGARKSNGNGHGNANGNSNGKSSQRSSRGSHNDRHSNANAFKKTSLGSLEDTHTSGRESFSSEGEGEGEGEGKGEGEGETSAAAVPRTRAASSFCYNSAAPDILSTSFNTAADDYVYTEEEAEEEEEDSDEEEAKYEDEEDRKKDTGLSASAGSRGNWNMLTSMSENQLIEKYMSDQRADSNIQETSKSKSPSTGMSVASGRGSSTNAALESAEGGTADLKVMENLHGL